MKTERRASSGYLVALCSLIYFVSYFARKDFAAVLAAMLSDGIIDKSIGGFIGMGLFICYGVGQLVSGYLGDRIRPTILLMSGLVTTAVCNFLMPIVPTTGLMIPVWALNGFAQAMLWPPIVRILSDNLDHERFVMSNLIVTSAAHVSTILLYVYVPICLQFADWKTVFFTATIVSSVAIVIFAISLMLVTMDKKPAAKKQETAGAQTTDEKPSDVNFLALFAKSGVFMVFFAIIMMGFLRDGIESWLPTLYSEAFDRGAGESILVSAILPIFSILSITVITALHKTRLFSNETRGAAVLFALAIVLCIPMAILINFEQSALRLICLILAAFVCACMHAINFLYISCLPSRFAKFGKAATASGFCNACTYVGAAISMYGIGAISDLMGWSITVVSWIAVAAIGALFSLLAFGKYRGFVQKGE